MLGEQRWNPARCLHSARHDSEISLRLLLATSARFSNSPGQSVLGFSAVTRLNKHHRFTLFLPEPALIPTSSFDTEQQEGDAGQRPCNHNPGGAGETCHLVPSVTEGPPAGDL